MLKFLKNKSPDEGSGAGNVSVSGVPNKEKAYGNCKFEFALLQLLVCF